MSLTTAEQLHHQPQFILHHKGGIIRHNVWMVALAHSLDLFLHREENNGYKVTQEAELMWCSVEELTKYLYYRLSGKQGSVTLHLNSVSSFDVNFFVDVI